MSYPSSLVIFSELRTILSVSEKIEELDFTQDVILKKKYLDMYIQDIAKACSRISSILFNSQ